MALIKSTLSLLQELTSQPQPCSLMFSMAAAAPGGRAVLAEGKELHCVWRGGRLHRDKGAQSQPSESTGGRWTCKNTAGSCCLPRMPTSIPSCEDPTVQSSRIPPLCVSWTRGSLWSAQRQRKKAQAHKRKARLKSAVNSGVKKESEPWGCLEQRGISWSRHGGFATAIHNKIRRQKVTIAMAAECSSSEARQLLQGSVSPSCRAANSQQLLCTSSPWNSHCWITEF